MAKTIGGFPVSPAQGMGLFDRLIYYPEFGGGESLYDDPTGFDNIRKDFAGGILNGAQYDPVSNRFYALNPSGTYTMDSMDRDAPTAEEPAGDGAFTLEQVLGFRDKGLMQANRGNLDPLSIFDLFENAGGNTYKIKSGSEYSGLLSGLDAEGNRVPLNQAVDDAGNKLSEQAISNQITAKLASIDESN